MEKKDSKKRKASEDEKVVEKKAKASPAKQKGQIFTSNCVVHATLPLF